MTKEKSPARQGPRYIFYFLMLAILGWFIFMQFFGADERTVSGNSPSLLYPGTFTWEKSDGTTEEITVPGSYDVPAGETMVITSTLPSDFDASSIAIRSSLQDVNIYINGIVISLKSCVKYSSGDGSSSNPYEIKETSSGC